MQQEDKLRQCKTPMENAIACSMRAEDYPRVVQLLGMAAVDKATRV
jgi:hypothetical protein